MKLFLAADHAAVEAKEFLLQHLKDKYECEDLGPYQTDRVNYPDYATKLCQKIISTPDAKGILLCGSGIGMSMAANRYQKIRAALCRTVVDAQLSREHNDANVLCLGARTTHQDLLLEITQAWLEAQFEGGRHTERIKLFNDQGVKL